MKIKEYKRIRFTDRKKRDPNCVLSYFLDIINVTMRGVHEAPFYFLQEGIR
jgi:hypothetical protein